MAKINGKEEIHKQFLHPLSGNKPVARSLGSVAICIPTRNAGPKFTLLLEMIKIQELGEMQLVIIDSSSTDGTAALSREAGALVKIIPQATFNHGAARNLAYQMVEADIYIFMTQDALPADRYTLKNLLSPFSLYPEVGLVYARQLPLSGAGPIEAFSRFFTYPATSQLKKISDRSLLGIKTVHCSNSCAAYFRDALVSVGGFPDNVIMCEDVYTAARIMEAGYDIYYQADALVYHSHNYSIWQDFQRYFDLGVFYESRERWIIEAFGGTKKQGARFFLEGLRYLNDKGCGYLFPEWVGRTAAKFCGYKLGSLERFLPKPVKRSISMHKNYWLPVDEVKKLRNGIS
jgi:rhamnosyltransferase